MTQKDRKYIVISKTNYESLRNLGTITDSFDSVITKLLREQQKKEVLTVGGQKDVQ
jgi:predicted CopG family antitoxin